ncbi:hypothetical protein Poli38472_001010 [Pythium oligandrum]|uniref:Reverse transcriptase domain-containing protein n=1 Tax=Pythium oligandrum TaxID=41045 RepID=A0A8K1CTA5_PYTOL|nr:hypothetical protein Poli38472_001010 [Pythium oligandrum]|eukprot:TMW68854.1 hypothetical protein Poli38472_001010 [Pythium oligandrum]
MHRDHDDPDPGFNPKIYVPNRLFQPPRANPFVEAKLALCLAQLRSNDWTLRRSSNLNSSQRHLLKSLVHAPHLKVLMTDKNLGPALMTHQQYVDFCLDHLLDPEIYKPIYRARTDVEAQLKLVVAAFHSSALRRYGEMSDLKIVIYQLPLKRLNRFYALAKIHKPQLAPRPIISNANSILQGLSSWLDFKLQPYLHSTSSYLKDSTSLISELSSITLTPTQHLITFDIQTLYTSIDVKSALVRIRSVIRADPHADIIMEGLQRVLFLNYFEFGDTIWKQINGCAMGTAVAPTFVSLYLASVEDAVIFPRFRANLSSYKRYIDDGFFLWDSDPTQPCQLPSLFAAFSQATTLKFTHTISRTTCDFLDLVVYRMNDELRFRTHQKPLNLYLYLPPHSAHPPGVLKGMIYGLVQKYRVQNTADEDFRAIVQLLFKRLLHRGHKFDTLVSLFNSAVARLDQARSELKTTKIFFKIQYDPNGPSRQQLRDCLRLDELQPLLKRPESTQLVLCYQRPPTLRSQLCKTSLATDRFPTPADRLITRMLHEMNGTGVGNKTQNPETQN